MTRETLTMATVAFMTLVFGIIDFMHDKIHIVTIAMALASVLYFGSLYMEKGFSMFNFNNWRKPKERYPTWADIPPHDYGLPEATAYPEVPKVVVPETEDGYTVGVDDQNKTVVKVTCNYSTTTLTMNEAGVRQMIRLLEATLPHATKE